ncbi:hypothetical protein [uncultured Stenotrophomonas sp.]|uniref:hypothetical protein n=1 Tax=uncultured Stenotrophomonas sp. TaxID=165438 RepID=UPI0025E1C4EB|nr:hypothetical protein [uncultured Stenotrophomonas sp.]
MPLRRFLRYLLPCLLLSIIGTAQADSWAPPSLKVVASSDGQALARVTPGSLRGGKESDVELYSYDAKNAQYALKTRFQLRNRIAPVEILLTGQGQLVALDDWAQMGHGTVLAVYASDGKLRLQFTLEELLGAEAAAKAPTSTSSTWWRCRKPRLNHDDSQLLIDTYDNGKLRVGLFTGNVEYEAGNGSCA